MGLLELIFGAKVARQHRSTRAEEIMRRANPHALICYENGITCMVEDIRDPDARLYRVEIQSTPDGRHAIARVRHSPWGSLSDMHCLNGVICLGVNGHWSNAAWSPYRLEDVIRRARFWCTAISVFHETGRFPSP